MRNFMDGWKDTFSAILGDAWNASPSKRQKQQLCYSGFLEELDQSVNGHHGANNRA